MEKGRGGGEGKTVLLLFHTNGIAICRRMPGRGKGGEGGEEKEILKRNDCLVSSGFMFRHVPGTVVCIRSPKTKEEKFKTVARECFLFTGGCFKLPRRGEEGKGGGKERKREICDQALTLHFSMALIRSKPREGGERERPRAAPPAAPHRIPVRRRRRRKEGKKRREEGKREGGKKKGFDDYDSHRLRSAADRPLKGEGKRKKRKGGGKSDLLLHSQSLRLPGFADMVREGRKRKKGDPGSIRTCGSVEHFKPRSGAGKKRKGGKKKERWYRHLLNMSLSAALVKAAGTDVGRREKKKKGRHYRQP